MDRMDHFFLGISYTNRSYTLVHNQFEPYTRHKKKHANSWVVHKGMKTNEWRLKIYLQVIITIITWFMASYAWYIDMLGKTVRYKGWDSSGTNCQSNHSFQYLKGTQDQETLLHFQAWLRKFHHRGKAYEPWNLIEWQWEKKKVAKRSD